LKILKRFLKKTVMNNDFLRISIFMEVYKVIENYLIFQGVYENKQQWS